MYTLKQNYQETILILIMYSVLYWLIKLSHNPLVDWDVQLEKTDLEGSQTIPTEQVTITMGFKWVLWNWGKGEENKMNSESSTN